MDVRRSTWTAAIKLAIVLSFAAVAIAIVSTRLGNVPQAAIIIPVMLVAFSASWIQTERIYRRKTTSLVILPARRANTHAA
jgi:hypothetical protein